MAAFSRCWQKQKGCSKERSESANKWDTERSPTPHDGFTRFFRLLFVQLKVSRMTFKIQTQSLGYSESFIIQHQSYLMALEWKCFFRGPSSRKKGLCLYVMSAIYTILHKNPGKPTTGTIWPKMQSEKRANAIWKPQLIFLNAPLI